MKKAIVIFTLMVLCLCSIGVCDDADEIRPYDKKFITIHGTWNSDKQTGLLNGTFDSTNGIFFGLVHQKTEADSHSSCYTIVIGCTNGYFMGYLESYNHTFYPISGTYVVDDGIINGSWYCMNMNGRFTAEMLD